MIYWDANSTYGVDTSFLKDFADNSAQIYNPSSIHRGGQNSKIILEECRETLVRVIDAIALDVNVVFTSGATEANNQALWSALYPYNFKGEILVSAVEHPSIIEPAKNYQELGAKVTSINPNDQGEYTASLFLDKITDKTRIVCLMLANNENGHIYPLKNIVKEIREKYENLWIHVDAVQGLGKIDFSFTEIDADSMSFSAHKIGALPGIGALVSKRKKHLTALISGGPQELRHRAGTENWVGIASFLHSLKRCYGDVFSSEFKKGDNSSLKDRYHKMNQQREILVSLIKKEIPTAKFPFEEKVRLPNTFNLNFANISADDLVVSADLRGLCISSGSACASGKPDPSHVLMAYGMSEEEAKRTIRISLRADITNEDLQTGVKILKECVEKMENLSMEKHQ